MVIVLNCVGGRIIGPFHQTVKIWSNLLDIQLAEYHYFWQVSKRHFWQVSDHHFCQVSDHRLQSAQFRNIRYSVAREQAVALDASGAVPASQPVVSAPRGEK
jgi:hypothetical protein